MLSITGSPSEAAKRLDGVSGTVGQFEQSATFISPLESYVRP